MKVLPGGMVKLSLDADQGVVIVPSGTDPNKETQNTVSGQVTFNGKDTQTKGLWQGKYGSDGYFIPRAGEKIPKKTTIRFINGQVHTWKDKTQDIQAIQIPGEKESIAASRSHPLHEIIDFNFEDGKEHDVAVYFLDWDRKGRWTVVDIIDADSGKILHSFNLTGFEQGVYLKYTMKGRLQCRITNVWSQRYQKSPDAGFSAIFFDPETNQ